MRRATVRHPGPALDEDDGSIIGALVVEALSTGAARTFVANSRFTRAGIVE